MGLVPLEGPFSNYPSPSDNPGYGHPRACTTASPAGMTISFAQLISILCREAETAASGRDVWQHYLIASHRDSKLSIAA
jgi:hypothetical protein